MKKVFFSLAIATIAAVTMASCGGNKSEKAEATAEGEQNTEQIEQPAAPAAEEAPAKVESRGQSYQVAIPAGWESKQYVSNMIVKKDSKELDFKEGDNDQIANWNMKGERQEDITVDGRTWQVYKNEGSFKVAYLAQVKNAVVRVGSNVDDINDADVLKVLAGVKEWGTWK